MANATKPVAKLNPVSEVKKLLKELDATKKPDGSFVISESSFKKIGDLPKDVTLVQNKSNPDMYCFKVGDERIVFEVINPKVKEKKEMEKKETVKKTTTKAPAKKAPAKTAEKPAKAPATKGATKPTTKTEKPVKKASATSGRVMPPHTSKGRGTGYVVTIKKVGEKEKKLTNMTTCAEIKEFLKANSRKEIEYLHIHDAEGKECRKSAWIDK